MTHDTHDHFLRKKMHKLSQMRMFQSKMCNFLHYLLCQKAKNRTFATEMSTEKEHIIIIEISTPQSNYGMKGQLALFNNPINAPYARTAAGVHPQRCWHSYPRP